MEKKGLLRRAGQSKLVPLSNCNQQLAAIFHQMAQLIEVTGGQTFRAVSFDRAARVLEDMTEDVSKLDQDISRLTVYEGIGEGTAKRIIEFLQTGQIADHQQLLAKVPPGLMELMHLGGMGPKTVALIWKQAKVQSLADLKARLADGGLEGIKGLGPKKIDNIRKAIELYSAGSARVLLGKALPLARLIVDRLRGLKIVAQADYAGSLRRGRETVGDVDIIVAAQACDAAAVSDAFVGLGPVAQVLAKGPTKTSVRTGEGLQVDLRVVPSASYGAALLYFTGSKEHNVLLRARASDRGMLLNEYGLFADREGKTKSVAAVSEAEVYTALGLAWIPPELREARNEIALAEAGTLPKLITLADIKAELHAHTTASDGKWSIEDLARAAAERGYHTVAVTDHSVSQVIAHGLTAQRLEEHITAIRAVAKRLQGAITVLAGSEVDILADGRLDYPNSLLKELDIVVASPHSALSQSTDKATPRLLKAIENPYVTILGHPTGRLIQRREGLSLDMKQIAAAAAQRGIALEINANSWRLDLRDQHARMALEAGVKLAINTDAHSSVDLEQLPYGILTARRAGAAAADVINCMGAAELKRFLASTRK